MTVCPAEETIQAFVEGRLRPEQRSSTEAHVSQCGDCGALVAAVAASWHEEGRLRGVDESAPSPFVKGDRIGQYEILAPAGRGAMGEVYRARDHRLGRDVALKAIPSRFAQDAARLARFRQEARAVGALSHPNLITLLDVGVHEGVPYLVTQWLEGTTLRERLVRSALGPDGAVRLGEQLARGLAAAHALGIVHRDIKPSNVFLCADGSCRLLDFGLARLDPEPEDAGLTQSGAVVGTAGYMAPEQIRGEPADHRADLFALGAVLYEAATGRAPFQGQTSAELMTSALRDEPPAVEGPLGEVIARCLAKAPEHRFQSAADLAYVLGSLRHAGERPRPARRPRTGRQVSLAAGAMLVVAVAGALIIPRVFAVQPGPTRPTYQPVTFRRGHVLTARLSADGHTVIYGAAWEGGRAELYTARADHPVSQPLGINADVLAASSRGELALLLEPRFFDADHGTGTLARVPLAGGAPRAVMEGVLEADWGPSGDELAVVRREGGRYRLEYPPGTVRFESEGWISHIRVSPTGGRIAFLFHPNPKDDRGAVMVLEEGATPRELAGGWASVRGLAWASAEELWFTGSKTDSDYALHSVDLGGTTRLVDRVAGRLVLHDVSRDGTALLDHELVRTGLAFARDGVERDLTWADGSFLTDLSPDGKVLLFTESGGAEGSSYGAYLRTTDGAPPVRLGDGIPFALSPDKRQVLAARYGEQTEFWLLPTGAGQPRKVSLAPVEVLLGARWFPDGKRLVLRGSAAGRPARLWVFDVGAGVVRPLTPEGAASEPAISPDGESIAQIDDAGSLRLLSTSGEVRSVVPGRFEGLSAIGFDERGGSVFVRNTNLPAEVRKVDLATGAMTPHRSIPAQANRAGLVSVMTLAVSADGSAYAWSYQEGLSRLYLVKGLSRPR